MRKLATLALLLASACATAPGNRSVTTANEPPAGPYGMTITEEARILALEDRRELDAELVARWVTHPNPLHRLRIALALARIGPHAFIDDNADDRFSPPGERRAGVKELMTLASDPDRRVREMVAFALGEIADLNGAPTLFFLAADNDLGVAAEAAEALSKLAVHKEFNLEGLDRYLWMTDEKTPEGVRARAVRYLFRFDSPKALEAAQRALASASSAVRQEAVYALARKPHGPARDQILLLLSDPNVLTRAYAATALGRIGEAAAAPALIRALGDIHPWVRTNAAIALGRIAEKDRSVLRSEDLPRIFATTEDADPGVRASVIDTLAYYAESNETARNRLISILANGTQWERELATGAVAKHFPPASGMARYVSANTSWQIVRFAEGTATAQGAWFRAIYAAHPEPLVRAAVLGAIPDDAANAEADLIRKGMQDPDVIVRATAYDRSLHIVVDFNEWLKAMKEAEVRERAAPMNDARIAAINSIAQYDHRERLEYLSSFLTDDDPVVRRVAADLIAQKHSIFRRYTPLPVKTTQSEYEEIVRWSREPHMATIHMTRGVIELALMTQDAPMTTWNFAQLAKKKFYDNTSFMRVVPNFVIQGGDPRNDMNGGPGYAIRDEINLQKYTRGAVGMALSGPDTGGSQFFVTHSPQPHLDGGYTIFGRVYEGMSGVVDQTERGDRVETITIDTKPPAGAEQISSVPNVSLPLEIGPMTADHLLSAVPEYAQRSKEYQPDITVVEMMKSYVHNGDRVEVYMGTWCSDSQREVPRFLRILEDLHTQFGVELPATFVAVDRSKQKPADLIEGKSIDKVATFIYYRGDQELGRIVERPKAVFEDDLLAIAAAQ